MILFEVVMDRHTDVSIIWQGSLNQVSLNVALVLYTVIVFLLIFLNYFWAFSI